MLDWRKLCLNFIAPATVICLISGYILFPGINRTEFHGDESGWIWSAYYYTELVMQWDFDLQKWECERCGPWGDLNMHVGKLLIGIPLAIDPQTRGANL